MSEEKESVVGLLSEPRDLGEQERYTGVANDWINKRVHVYDV